MNSYLKKMEYVQIPIAFDRENQEELNKWMFNFAVSVDSILRKKSIFTKIEKNKLGKVNTYRVYYFAC